MARSQNMHDQSPLDAVRARAWTAILVSLASFGIALGSFLYPGPSRHPDTPNSQVPGLLDRLEQAQEIHAGYGVYPPYTQEDPTTKNVSGFSVDLLEEIGKQVNSKVIWHRLNWNTMSADLKRGSFDVIADPIFETVPRGREFAFTLPYAFFADGVGVVKRGDRRFPTFESVDTPSVTVAVGQGWASEAFVKARFSKATIRPVQTTTDLLQLFNEVVAGRADIAIADAADASRYAKEHPEQVDVLFADNPPTYIPAGFALRIGDRQGAEFLDVAIRSLEATGVLDALARKYGVVVRPAGAR